MHVNQLLPDIHTVHMDNFLGKNLLSMCYDLSIFFHLHSTLPLILASLNSAI